MPAGERLVAARWDLAAEERAPKPAIANGIDVSIIATSTTSPLPVRARSAARP